jgi:hypothetical protein
MRQESITEANQEVPTLVEPHEGMVADIRGGLTPSQMVERKFQALLDGNGPGCFVRGTGRPGDLQRVRGR